MSVKPAPALFIPHGGGPLPLLKEKSHKPMIDFLTQNFDRHFNLTVIKAIIVVTAHWEEDIVSISSSDHHDLYFDYYNFPPESYKYRYDAPGDPTLAKRVYDRLTNARIQSRLDSKRGWDHGVFVPMLLINPKADIPILQVSVLLNQDAGQHLEIGKALREFRKEGVAILGSGMSFHNMRHFRDPAFTREGICNVAFDGFLEEACGKYEDERVRLLKDWRQQEGASESHPLNKAEHLMPLLVVAGAGGAGKGQRVLTWDYMGKFRLGAFLWDSL